MKTEELPLASFLSPLHHRPYSKMANIFRVMIVLFVCKLPLVASFKIKSSFEVAFKNEATRATLQAKKRILQWWPFWNTVYCHLGLTGPEPVSRQ